MKKKGLSILVALALVLPLVLALPVYAAEEGSVTGQFGINVAPTVDSASLTATAMTPQTEYTVSVQVSDADTINDLSTVVLKVWYDSDGGTPSEGEFDGQSADVQSCAVITWTADDPGGTTYTGSAALTPAGTTWSLGASTLPAKGGGANPGDFGDTTFTFQFVFTVGKVATETPGSDIWQIAAKATDTMSQTGWNNDGEGSSVNYYGEITVPAATVDWGSMKAGTDFNGTGSQQALGVTVSYVANGNYDKKVKSGASWSGSTYTGNLDATGACGSAQQFALRADDTATYNVSTAVLVDTTGVSIDAAGTQTSEAGDSVAAMNLWLKLASTFNSDTYSGTITYSIVNR